MLVLIVQKKGFDALNTTQKKPQLCENYNFFKNQEKPAQNDQTWSKCLKISIMSHFFFIVLGMVVCT